MWQCGNVAIRQFGNVSMEYRDGKRKMVFSLTESTENREGTLRLVGFLAKTLRFWVWFFTIKELRGIKEADTLILKVILLFDAVLRSVYCSNYFLK
jgi:hypothetical protein